MQTPEILDPAADLTFVARPQQQVAAQRRGAGGRPSRISQLGSSVTVELGTYWRPGDAGLLLDGLRQAKRGPQSLVLREAGAGGAALVRAAAIEDTELKVSVLRRGDRRAAQDTPGWRHHALDVRSQLDPSARIAITGGLGGIGLRLAEHFARRRHPLLLIDKRDQSELSASAQKQLAAVQQQTQVLICRLDLQRSRLPERSDVQHLIHAAGEFQLGAAAELDSAELERYALSKADSLENALAGLSAGLLSVVAFGSIESRRPHQLFGGYALANELLRLRADALRSRYPTVAITVAEWSLWSQVGMAAEVASEAADRGFATVDPAWGARATSSLLASGWQAPDCIALGGRQSLPSHPVRVVRGIGGTSLRTDPEAVRLLRSLCRPDSAALLCRTDIRDGDPMLRALANFDGVHVFSDGIGGWHEPVDALVPVGS